MRIGPPQDVDTRKSEFFFSIYVITSSETVIFSEEKSLRGLIILYIWTQEKVK